MSFVIQKCPLLGSQLYQYFSLWVVFIVFYLKILHCHFQGNNNLQSFSLDDLEVGGSLVLIIWSIFILYGFGWRYNFFPLYRTDFCSHNYWIFFPSLIFKCHISFDIPMHVSVCLWILYILTWIYFSFTELVPYCFNYYNVSWFLFCFRAIPPALFYLKCRWLFLAIYSSIWILRSSYQAIQNNLLEILKQELLRCNFHRKFTLLMHTSVLLTVSQSCTIK